jgi:hypothetical protein
MHADAHAIEQAAEHLDRQEKLRLIEVLARSLQQAETGPTPAQRRANLEWLRQELEALPIGNPDDGRSNRNHDTLLYGA